MQVTLGGDRLGSGNKQKIALRHYERSTHDLSQSFTSSMQVGTLYPFLVIPAMRGDKFDIDLTADARTIPTKGPLFGSFKMQVDVFQCDVRLYQAILHNNPLAIGLNMGQVKFPLLDIKDHHPKAFSNTCLLKYLGMSGIGSSADQNGRCKRKINAIPALAYYEIFKTYYANKQEENAYVIGSNIAENDMYDLVLYNASNQDSLDYNELYPISLLKEDEIEIDPEEIKDGWQKYLFFEFYTMSEGVPAFKTVSFEELRKKGDLVETGPNIYKLVNLGNQGVFLTANYVKLTCSSRYYISNETTLSPFPLKNIDAMRLKLLSYHTLGSAFVIDDTSEVNANKWNYADGELLSEGLPYTALVGTYTNPEDATVDQSKNHTALNGLLVKTYQADIYNTWVNTDWIDGENGIANVTAIAVNDGKVKIDSINFSEKLYNMLNRVAVSDGSYEGWQDAVYTETPKRHIESPVYLGGMSSEIVFEEIVQTSQGDENNPLGTLGGKGKLLKRKGGHVTVKCNEACFIIGIVSLTPRINYTQGNEFYLTDLLSMDDYHKPALDGIGFQNLIGERLAWWNTAVMANGTVQSRQIVGKVPAWIEYMTAVDKCYGDFAETEGRGFMALQRDYTRDGRDIVDATTYIDPRKYNYAFAYNGLDAQNFWVQIQSNIKARRLMSAKQIPNI